MWDISVWMVTTLSSIAPRVGKIFYATVTKFLYSIYTLLILFDNSGIKIKKNFLGAY